MKYRITLLHNDGTQENYATDDPKYDKLNVLLTNDCIKSFVVTLNQNNI